MIDDRAGLRQVAVWQRNVLFCVLGQFGIGVLRAIILETSSPALAIVFLVLALALLVYMLASVSNLSKALGVSSIIYLILMFVPCVSLIALLVLNGKATTRLQSAGIKVGLLGANPKNI